jgi:thiosulfate/3-mercaptopyruvate sulfurtransferase
VRQRGIIVVWTHREPRMLRASLAALLVSLLLPATSVAQPLLTPADLSARVAQPQLRIVDIRAGKNEAGKTPYEVGHIAGALHAPYPQWRGPKDNPGKLPATEALTALVQQLGIDATTPVVIVYEGANSTDFGAAARVYWTLKVAGVAKPSILNGGMKAWRSAGFPVTTAVAAVAPSRFVVTLDRRLIATQDEVAQIVGGNSAILLDARPVEYYAGETRHIAAKTPGTIVGAKNVDNAVFFGQGSGALLPAADVRRIADQHGLQTDRPTVSFCNTGHWAATNWFVLSEILGQKNARLYPESVVEWSRAGLAMDNVPSRIHQAWLQLKEAAGSL